MITIGTYSFLNQGKIVLKADCLNLKVFLEGPSM